MTITRITEANINQPDKLAAAINKLSTSLTVLGSGAALAFCISLGGIEAAGDIAMLLALCCVPVAFTLNMLQRRRPKG